jgi:uncharacterized protein YjeT (DUF2065 family)
LSANTLWVPLALVLVVEGLFPFLSPAGWRRMFTQLLQLNDGQIRFFGLASILGGLLLIWWLLP